MSTSKYAKMNKRNHWGRGACWGKGGLKFKVKGISFFTGSDRQQLKRELFMECV